MKYLMMICLTAMCGQLFGLGTAPWDAPTPPTSLPDLEVGFATSMDFVWDNPDATLHSFTMDWDASTPLHSGNSIGINAGQPVYVATGKPESSTYSSMLIYCWPITVVASYIITLDYRYFDPVVGMTNTQTTMTLDVVPAGSSGGGSNHGGGGG